MKTTFRNFGLRFVLTLYPEGDVKVPHRWVIAADLTSHNPSISLRRKIGHE
jgi:hypothetical protein